jgi:gas vesicle protein
MVGGAIGATIALLFAPNKGKYLRADISKKATEIKDGTSDIVRETTSRISNLVADTQKNVVELKKKAEKVIGRIG